jgi:hypothetical protein
MRYRIEFQDASWPNDLLAIDRLLLPDQVIEAADVDKAFREGRAIAIANGIEPDRCDITVEDIATSTYYME